MIYFQSDSDPLFPLNLSSSIFFSGFPISGSYNAYSFSFKSLSFISSLSKVKAEITHSKRIILHHLPK